MAINGFHALFFSTDAAADRAFLRDVLGFDSVIDGPPGPDEWRIFRLPPAELGVHPAEQAQSGEVASGIYLLCDDLAATMADLRARGAAFDGEPSDQGWGIVAHLRLPSGGLLGLYEPRHATAHAAD